MSPKVISGQDLVKSDGDLATVKRAIARAKSENCHVQFKSGLVNVTVAGDSDPELIVETINIQFSSANIKAIRVVEAHPKMLTFDPREARLYQPTPSKPDHIPNRHNAVKAYQVKEAGWATNLTQLKNEKLVPRDNWYLFPGDWFWRDEITGEVGISVASNFKNSWIV